MRVSPAEYVIRVFGGVRKTAKIIGRDPANICRWRRPLASQGTGGRIPSQAQQDILAKARELKLDITPEDLLLGREL